METKLMPKELAERMLQLFCDALVANPDALRALSDFAFESCFDSIKAEIEAETPRKAHLEPVL